MKTNNLIKYLVLINVFIFITFFLIQLKTKNLVETFEKDTTIIKDTTNVQIFVPQYNFWLKDKFTITESLFRLDCIVTKDGKCRVINQLYSKFILWNINTGKFNPVQMFTYMFLHGNLTHIFFNMISLITLGTILLKVVDNKKFLTVYLLGGMVAGIVHMFMTLNMDLPTVGASGAVWALIGMFFLTHTEERMSFLFIPINMKVKHLVAILFVIEVVLAINSISTTDGLAHWAHIGGCIFGYLYYKLNNKTQS